MVSFFSFFGTETMPRRKKMAVGYRRTHHM
jgi:hypothetical protein